MTKRPIILIRIFHLFRYVIFLIFLVNYYHEQPLIFGLSIRTLKITIEINVRIEKIKTFFSFSSFLAEKDTK